MSDRLISHNLLKTELEFLVEAIRTMRQIRQEQGLLAGEAFQKQMEDYFHLGHEMRNTLVYDELLRLADTEAGTLVMRDDAVLQRLHTMKPGDRFTIDGHPCVFVRHMRLRMGDRDGVFEYTYLGDTVYRPIHYNQAWSLAQAERLRFG